MRKLLGLVVSFIFLILAQPTLAASSSYVSVVNPVRGSDFAEAGFDLNQTIVNQQQVLTQRGVGATWLLRYDVMKNPELLNRFANLPAKDEAGLFLEVTPSWTNDAGVNYRTSEVWHNAGSLFLTGYENAERTKLIDTAFEQFKQHFGRYPVSVGAWWVDAGSMAYMQEKYGVKAVLVVADQYSTDNYQIWGQYFGYPYYPMKRNGLYPAQSATEKVPVVVMQWAARDPVNGYGKGVEESTYSVQANDYIDYHDLGIDYFNKLIDLYTKQPDNQINQIVVGLENTYAWSSYGVEYTRQIESLVSKQRQGQLRIATMGQFSQTYLQTFPTVSPSQVIVANDPLGSEKQAVWWMNPYYRATWVADGSGSRIVDLRQYVEGRSESCLEKSCRAINFATEATRVLDVVTNGQQWLLTDGKVSGLKFGRVGDKGILSYTSAAGQTETVEFLPRDIGVGGKIYSIDAGILYARQLDEQYKTEQKAGFLTDLGLGLSEWGRMMVSGIMFLVVIWLAIYVPGRIWIGRVSQSNFLAVVIGMVSLTLVGLISYWLKLPWLVWLWLIGNLAWWVKQRGYQQLDRPRLDKADWWLWLIILAGVIFQLIPVIRSGLTYGYGMGWWGPNTHDGVWHVALINQLIQSVPLQNPTFGGTNLTNYHYLYDLLVAVIHQLSRISVLDLVFRLMPALLSLLLGIGTWGLLKQSDRINRWMIGWALLFVYFAGSFGWVVSVIKRQEWGGESAFWANQAVSYNLNPPFAISVIILIAIIRLLVIDRQRPSWWSWVWLAILAGVILGFKAYAGVLVGVGLAVVAVWQLIKARQVRYVGMGLMSGVILIGLLALTFGFKGVGEQVGSTFIWSPWWFIHSMIDFTDRVGWVKLSSARQAYFERGEWWKFGLAELVGLVIFMVGNLGLRIFVLGGIGWLKRLLSQPAGLFSLVVGLVGLLIPLFWIQSGTAWNTIQFMYYGLFLTAIGAGVVVGSWWRGRVKWLVAAIYVIILLVMPISSLTTAKGYFYPLPHAYISNGELAGLQFLMTQPQGVVMAFPFDQDLKKQISEPYPLIAYDSTAYVSAISGKPSFVADAAQNEILGTDYLQRVAISKTILGPANAANRALLEQTGVRYIYLPKVYHRFLDEQVLGVKNIFENDEVIIYEAI